MSKNGNEASFDTGAPFFTITPKQMRWLHITTRGRFCMCEELDRFLRYTKIITHYEKRIGSRGESRNPRCV